VASARTELPKRPSASAGPTPIGHAGTETTARACASRASAVAPTRRPSVTTRRAGHRPRPAQPAGVDVRPPAWSRRSSVSGAGAGPGCSSR